MLFYTLKHSFNIVCITVTVFHYFHSSSSSFLLIVVVVSHSGQ